MKAHPDDYFINNSSINNEEDLQGFLDLKETNPQLRKAEVTTLSGPLRVKVEPRISANTFKPHSSLQKGEIIDVYWPTNIQNDHIKIRLENKFDGWVSYKSRTGHIYISLLENRRIEQVKVPEATLKKGHEVQKPKEEDFFQSVITFAINLAKLPMNLIEEAFKAISSVGLKPQEITACDFNPLIGNSSSQNNCYEKVVLSEEFSQFISEHGYQCAQKAAKDTFQKEAAKVMFNTAQAGQVRRNRRVSGSGKKSIHSTGQALDLFGITLFFNESSTRKITLHKNAVDGQSSNEKENHKFYWSFVNCWRERVQQTSPCNCDKTKSGALTYLYNSAHKNHIHASLPFCERKTYNVACI